MTYGDKTIGDIRWVHIKKPDSHDIDFIKSVFPFHRLVMESIEKPAFHPLIEEYDKHFFLVLHFPLIYPGWEKNDIVEVDFLVTQDTVITVVHEEFEHLEKIFNLISEDLETKSLVAHTNTGILLYHIIHQLFARVSSDLNKLEEEIDLIEAQIFKKHERRMRVVEKISNVRMDILDFRRTFQPQQAVLKFLPQKADKFYDAKVVPYFFDLLNTEEKIRNIIDNQKESIESLHQTNESLMSGNTNNIITLLTVFSTIVLPLNFIASIWGMNHRVLPFRDGPIDFWIVVSAMGLIAAVMLVAFRKIRWL